MMIQYSADGNVAFYGGYKFRRDPKSGYFLCTRKTDAGRRERLHVYVWRKAHGDIPEGYHIHHKDENKRNNEPENLACIPGTLHESFHGKEYSVNHREAQLKNLRENATPSAKAWHSSDAGRAWHSEHAKQNIQNMEKKEYVCQYCGRTYFCLPVGGEKKFCSNACKMRARYESGVDNETRKCAACGKVFSVNKYAKTRCCSRQCAVQLRAHRECEAGGAGACL
ncbi:MAG: HNH endonuclease [Clostridiales bacterium]|nr:HNH endonuclease [Clostridiales bacterium]